MRRLLVLAAVALPVLGTVGGIALNEIALRDATTWRIPITGYDPRDPLRGRYIAFRYDWSARGDPALCRGAAACSLCLEEGGRAVRFAAKDASCPGRIDSASSGLRIASDLPTPGRLTVPARLWVSEADAPRLERRLRAGPMVAVARLTSGGRLVPDRLESALRRE